VISAAPHREATDVGLFHRPLLHPSKTGCCTTVRLNAPRVMLQAKHYEGRATFRPYRRRTRR
jgi:hypothetical protein